MSKYIAILILCFIGFNGIAQGQEEKEDKKPIEKEKVVSESYVVKKALLDRSFSDEGEQTKSVVFRKTPIVKTKMSVVKVSKPHSPALAWKLSMVLPGLGQIYNGQWWKVPIIYGAIGGAIYGVQWNNRQYNNYKYAFSDYVEYINQVVPEGQERVKVNDERWNDVYKQGSVKEFSTSNEEWFKNALKNRKDSYKRNRDLTVILTVGVYALNIIDALVSAHFYDFDISDDLSMGFRPSFDYNAASGNSLGLACSVKF